MDARAKGKYTGKGNGRPDEIEALQPTVQEEEQYPVELYADVYEENEEDQEEEYLQKKKKRNVPDALTSDQEQTLVEWFSELPIFFDQTERDSKNRSKRDRLLAEKSKAFDMTGADLGIWFKSQRTIFGRLSKRKSGQAKTSLTARQKWVMDNFFFLKSHIVVRSESRQLCKIPTPQEQSEAEDYEAAHTTNIQ